MKKIPHFREFVHRFRKKKTPSRDITELRMAMVINNHPDLRQEASYILQNINKPEEWFIPYPKVNSVREAAYGYDSKFGLPYVLHNGKRLYFPSTYSEDICGDIYKSFIEKECLLGGNYREKQPHQYESERCRVENGDCLVDVGCAEGIFALDHVDDTSKVYLIEGDAKWIPALRATFKEYEDKVVIINKYLSDSDSDNTITLNSIISVNSENHLFIKMDIEGAENTVLNSNKSILKSNNSIKLAVCTYHRLQDADTFSALFKEMGYQYEFSEGYLYVWDIYFNPVYPYFRHGVIRGWR